jgi:prepilin-type N-terminal cleavage/methylation domain-containing protein
MRTRCITERSLRRPGFTLLELLIVVAVMLALASITIISVNFSNKKDRLRAGARQIQSYLAGARDRAIYSKQQRGVRLIVDGNNKHTVVAMQYVGVAEPYSDGTITFSADPSMTNDPTGATICGLNTGWASLQSKGLLFVGAQIEIPANSGKLFTVASSVRSAVTPGLELLSLNKPVSNYANKTASLTYVLQLRPLLVPGSEVSSLPPGVVIDLDGSRLPPNWRPLAANLPYGQFMDIVFGPTGTVIGDAPTAGMVHLLVADVGDVQQWATLAGRSPTLWSLGTVPFVLNGIVPANQLPSSTTPLVKQDPIITTLNARSGNISVHPANPANSNNDQYADDPYRFAELGEVSNQ